MFEIYNESIILAEDSSKVRSNFPVTVGVIRLVIALRFHIISSELTSVGREKPKSSITGYNSLLIASK